MYSITEAAPLEFETFKRGKEGWAVIACQDALNSHFKVPPLALDGVFGPATQQAAEAVQKACGVTVDGIVGPETQEAFVKAKCVHAQKGMTPPGLLAGLCNIESSYQWACVSPLNSNGTHDYGVTQWSLTQPGESQLLAAFNPDTSAHTLAGEVRGFYNAVVGKVGNQRTWELAALNHNWPAAAFALADGNEAWLNKPFAFTTAKGYATGLDYANHYIAVATAQVTSWTVA
jgi:hypothetical protein